MSRAEVEHLIRALDKRLPLALLDDDVAALLGWIASSTRNPGARALNEALGPASKNEAITGHAFALLDRALFDQGRLLPEAAGVAAKREHDARRRRYRLLLSAFHPDRYPARSAWLTERSQIITRAYAAFKRGDDSAPEVSQSSAVAVRKPAPKGYGIAPTWRRRLTNHLRDRFGRDRWLAHKIIGGFALVLVLTGVSVLLEKDRVQGLESDGLRVTDYGEERVQEIEERVQGSGLRVQGRDGIEVAERAERVGRGDVSGDAVLAEATERVDRADVPGNSMPAGTTEPVGWAHVPGNSIPAEASEPVGRAHVPGNSMPVEPTERVGWAHVPGDLMLVEATEPVGRGDVSGDAVLAEATEPVGRGDVPGNALVAEATKRVGRAHVPGDSMPAEATEPVGRGDVPGDSVPAEAAESGSPVAVSLVPGRVDLGPLSRHRVGEVLQAYQAAIEAGDLEALLAVLGRNPTANGESSRDWFERHYRTLFEQSSERALSMRLIAASREGDGWLVELQHDLQLLASNDLPEQRSEKITFHVAPDPLGLRILGIRF